MRNFFIILLFLTSLPLFGQNYARVRVLLDQEQTVFKLARLGIDISHGDYHPGRYYANEFSEQQLEQIKNAGFEIKMMIPDLKAHYQAQNDNPVSTTRNASCSTDPVIEYETPANFALGSMGGFYTLEEMNTILDDMIEKYPNLISTKQVAGTSIEGRPIWWLRVSDNPNVDEAEPEVLYTALHHAREPNSLSQMIFYLWYLFENYETNEEIKYLVDNTEMYFMPCINPDGYVWNQTTDPNGGGFWRKNRRDNGNGSFGTDLNRNYGFQWGFDDAGSSPDPSNDTYRGPGPFSEPETQAVRDLCNAHEFQIAMNYHTFGNLLIYPWGYSDSPTPEHPTFQGFASAMTRYNNYFAGTGTETVGYTVNGDSDDWFYGEQTTKQRIFSMTPEVGPQGFGFWPPASAIEGLCKDNVWQNLTTARLVHNFGLADHTGEEFLTELDGNFDFTLHKYGLKTGNLAISVAAVSDNVVWVEDEKNYGLLTGESTQNAFQYILDSDIQSGDAIIFDLIVDYGYGQFKETHTKFFVGEDMSEVIDEGNSLDNWANGTEWEVTEEAFYSAPSSITDSPNADYDNNQFSTIELVDPIALVNLSEAALTYWARWEIEEDFDYAQVQISTNGFQWTNMCGRYTELGVPDQNQGEGEPLYDGMQDEWVQECINLSEYVDLATNPEIYIRFVFRSDGFLTMDGFYFDDMGLTQVGDGTTSTFNIDKSAFKFVVQPNPADQMVQLAFDKAPNPNKDTELIIFNTLGQAIYRNPIHAQITEIATADWDSGIYFAKFIQDGKTEYVQKIDIVR